VKVLIVDDEPSVRLLLSRVLRREVECQVSEATNGLEALDLLGRESFDFVVIDVMMPIMDGLETLDAIRRTPSLRHLPVMVLSAVRDEARIRQLVSLGISAYLTKPLRPLDASARVQQFVASVVSSARAAASRARLAVPAGARLLVVDGNAAYRGVVRDALSAQFDVAEAESGAAGLRACLETPPAAILLGQELGAVPASMFLRKVRGLPPLAHVPVVVANERGTDDPAVEADAFVSRTMVAEQLRQDVERLMAGSQAQPQLLDARPELRGQMVSAMQQVFGMLLGVDVSASDETPTSGEPTDDLVRVGFSVALWDEALEFGILLSREMSERTTAMLRPDVEVVGEDDIAATLREVAVIVASRIQNALRACGDDVTAMPPQVGPLALAPDLTNGWVPVGFRGAAGELRFTAYLRLVGKAAAVAPELHARAS